MAERSDTTSSHGQLGFEQVEIDGRPIDVLEEAVVERPFCVLRHLAREGSRSDPSVLIVPPLSGHRPILVHDMLSALLPEHDLYIADWIDARDVPSSAGKFGLDDNIGYAVDFLRALGPETHVIGLCQSVVPVLAAAALLAEESDRAQPASMTLMAGPVDARIHPTRVDRLLAQRSVDWFERNVVSVVPDWCQGAGRRIYPGAVQLAGLLSYLVRHVSYGGELFRKLVADDGDDPVRWPFHTLYTGVMDLPAEFFLEQLTAVFQEFALPRGKLLWQGRPVRPNAISRTALTTIEGEFDDIAAVGQTAAAHELCTSIPAARRRRHIELGVGHFGTFHGCAWRTRIMPIVRDAIRAAVQATR